MARDRLPDNYLRRFRISKGTLGALAALAVISLGSIEAPAAPQKRSYELLVFARDASSNEFAKQKAVISDQKDALRQRDIVVTYVIANRVEAELGAASPAIPVKLRAHYRVGRDEFRVILSGKDGEVILVSDAPVTVDQLFGTIDAVPSTSETPKEPAKKR